MSHNILKPCLEEDYYYERQKPIHGIEDMLILRLKYS
jgi:hypothetical protein